MRHKLPIANSDRLLILAPHPDDESIATGGLIQIARTAGATVRVIVLTDGDNNPWPQRWIEKRWHIDAAARARWGARRREEARAAMRVLGLETDAAVFLGLPDLGLTDLLMRNEDAVLGPLRQTIEEFRPTLVVIPAVSDRHPDHSAAHILARSILTRSTLAQVRLYNFAVHGHSSGSAELALTAEQQEIKRQAILAHKTQMRLSRGRFLRYAQPSEYFGSEGTVADENPEHSLRARFSDDGLLRVAIDLAQWGRAWRTMTVFVALDDGTRSLESTQRAQQSDGEARIEIRCPHAGPGYVKLALAQPGWRVFDRFGWQRIGRS